MLLAGTILSLSITSYSQDEEKTMQKNESIEHHHHQMKDVTIKKIGDDSTVVYIHKKCPGHDMMWDRNRDWDHFPGKHCPFACNNGKYNGHWAGVELGWNGFVNSNLKMDYPGYEFMDMNVARSMMVNLNPFELNLNLVKNHFGFTSGLGFQLDNYFLTGSYFLVKDSAKLTAYKIYDDKGNQVVLERNKLFEAWMNIPLLFEFQTNSQMKRNSFHFTAGVIGGIRIGAYQKEVYKNWNQMFYLKDENGRTVGTFYNDDKYTRQHGVFHLQNFKLDATVRIGWSFLNFFGTYSLTPMFFKNQGPEVYPWTMGITLLGW